MNYKPHKLSTYGKANENLHMLVSKPSIEIIEVESEQTNQKPADINSPSNSQNKITEGTLENEKSENYLESTVDNLTSNSSCSRTVPTLKNLQFNNMKYLKKNSEMLNYFCEK